MTMSRILAGTPNLVAAVNIPAFGVVAAVVAQALGASDQTALIIRVFAAREAADGLTAPAPQPIRRGMRMHHSRFPK